uniref:Uncharacterized protein n=1 Tax=Oryza rufipogon TaxID=4529 RepID=A0A0E0R561_ORYRU
MVSSGGSGGARHGVVAAWASFFSSRIGLDCQNYHTGTCPNCCGWVRCLATFQRLRCTATYSVLPSSSTLQSCWQSVIQRQRNAQSAMMCKPWTCQYWRTKLGSEDSTMDRIPPLVMFCGDLKRCCESMQVALAS